MDFQFTEEQLAIKEAATGIIAKMVDPDRVKAVEATEDRFDAELWAAMAAGDLLGFGIPEADGGNGGGLVELGQILEVQGRVVAPVPFHATMIEGAMPIARFGADALRARLLPGVVAGSIILTGALADAAASPSLLPRVGASEVDGSWRFAGTASAVPFAHVAHSAVVPARTEDGHVVVAVVPLDQPTVSLDRVETTNRSIHPNITFDGTLIGEDSILGGAEVLEAMLAWAQTGLALLQVGICTAALEQTAAHLNERTQFGRTLSSFQGTMLRAADAGIDTEAIRVTAWQAAWRLDEGLPAAEAVLIAKWQAADRGQRVVHATQHLHGGTGADIGYPIHRYFLWGKQIELELGGPSLQLSRLGALIAEHPDEVIAR